MSVGAISRPTRGVDRAQAGRRLESRRAGWGLFALGLAVNVAILLFVWGPGHLEPRSDEVEYYGRAERLLRGGGFEGVARTPGWPLLIAAVWHVTGVSVLAGKLINVAAGAGVPVAAFALARFWLPVRWAVVAGAGTALMPTVFVLNGTLYSETIATLGFLWANVFVLWGLRRAGDTNGKGFAFHPLHWAAFGVAMALVNLVKPAYVLWLAMLTACGAWYLRRHPLRYAAVVATAAASFCLVFSPWWARNVAETGRFVAFSTAGDASLIESNNPAIAQMKPVLREVGGRVTWIGPGHFMSDKVATALVNKEELDALDKVEQAALLRERALGWIAVNPGPWSVLALRKLAYGFGVWPLWQGSVEKLLVGLPFTIVAFLSLPAWWWIATRPGSHRILLLHPLTFVATTLLFFGSWRYRSAFEPSFLIACLIAANARFGKPRTQEPAVRS